MGQNINEGKGMQNAECLFLLLKQKFAHWAGILHLI